MKKLLSLGLFALSLIVSTNTFAKETIILSTINWQPYTGQDLPNDGFFSELVTKSLNQVGYDVEYKYSPWARALKEAKYGEVQGVMVTYKTKDREAFLSFPDATWKVSEVFTVLKGSKITYTGELSELKGVQVGMVRGHAAVNKIKSGGIKVQLVSSQDTNIKKLLSGRIDAMLIPKDIFLALLKKVDPAYNPANIVFLEPAHSVHDLYVAFSKKNPNYEKLTSDFNKGLKMIKENGTYNKIIVKYNIAHIE